MNKAQEIETKQKQLVQRFQRLEELFLRMSELEAESNPTHAGLLMQAAQLSKQLGTRQQLFSASELIAKGQLNKAIQEQVSAHENLQKLLELLQSENRGNRIRDERTKLEEIVNELRRLQSIQRSLRGRTEAGQDMKQAGADQKNLNEQIESLDNSIKPPDSEMKTSKSEGEKSEGEKSEGEKSEGEKSEGEKSEGEKSEGEKSEGEKSEGEKSEGEKSGGSSGEDSKPKSKEAQAKQRVQRAKARMKKAQQELEKNQREDAVQEQRAAEKELREAVEELEKVLRQLREEEIERSLVDLETRIRKMHELQKSVREETARLDDLQGSSRDRTLEIQANKLSIEQNKVVMEGQRALLLLQDEGSSTAFPEAMEQIVRDAQFVSKRLGAMNVSAGTQSLQDEVIASLEELLSSLKQVQKDREEEKKKEQQNSGGGGSPPPPPGDQPLVDKLAELRLLKTMQLRINRRTLSLAKQLDLGQDEGGQVEKPVEAPDAREELNDLAERQLNILEVTREILIKENQN